MAAYNIRKYLILFFILGCLALGLFGCGKNAQEAGSAQEGADFSAGSGTTVRILSGSENQELESILAEAAGEAGIRVEMTYKGSVDIMRALQSGANEYDAVWPASSMWISLGDEKHLVKHSQSVSVTPVVFGIRQGLAQELGFVGKDVSVRDILNAISQGRMSFCMTSATQSNSGASAYIGFLYALLGKENGMTAQDLQNQELQSQVRRLLSGVERSSGSSDWLKELFLSRDYDAMVNYECLIIDANEELTAQGREPLQVIYPYDGLSLADSPLGYVDHGSAKKEEAFLGLQEYLLSDRAQSAIEATGRRLGASGVSQANASVFNKDWGIDTERVLSPIQMPSSDVLLEALNLYQTSLKKPSLNLYCLDFSGSMSGDGEKALKNAMQRILVQSYASADLLQAGEGEVNAAVLFSDVVQNVFWAKDSSEGSLKELYDQIAVQEPWGGTDIYTAAEQALEIASGYDLAQYSPAIILMTDGRSEDRLSSFLDAYASYGMDIPVFSITFGDADISQLETLAEKTGGRVFDGTKSLTDAFRSVKGYN